MSDLLADLTPAQREAVTHMNGPMLVVAGAGSGKTRVVTRRIAYLIEQGVRPWRILALTFTNKAAREMRERVEALVGEAPAWMGTFHSICARMLRTDLERLGDGRTGRFTIMDQGDQESLIKQAMKRLDVDDKTNKPSSVLAAVSKAKSDFVTPEGYDDITPRDRVVKEVYAAYEAALRDNNTLDFDDLLVLAARLLKKDPEVLAKYRGRFPYILVDEYQDTNQAQYMLLRALAGTLANIHATGDPDQSIYSWRGADYRNIMHFQRDFPGARIVRLEENYRSSKHILAAANYLIKHNPERIDKDLYTTRPGGDKVTLVRLQSDRMEAMWVAERITELRGQGKKLGEMAVFYRTNAQSRALEEALLRESLPYQLIGGVRFYERREIKDLLAHLKVRINPRDLGSLRRVVACRPGVGERTLDKIAQAAAEAGEPVFTFLASPDFAARFKPTKKVQDFADWCRRLAEVDIDRADVAVKDVLHISNLIETTLANADKDELADDRIENLHALSGRAGEFVRLRLESAPEPDPDANEEEVRAGTAIDLAAFLEDVALVADVDGWVGDADKVTLMTLHSAKGLEFDDVFVTGLEEGLLPHRNCRDDNALQEERRLFYVGITRAKERAWITHAASRFIHGSVDFSQPSQFLGELPKDEMMEMDYGDMLSPETGSGYAGRRGGGGGWGRSAAEDDFADPDFGDVEVSDFLDIGGDFDPNPDFDLDPDFGFPGDVSPAPAAAEKKAWPKRAWPTAKPKPAARPSRYKPGDLVRHPQFGSGKVLTVDKRKIMVQFFSSGTRLLQEDLAQLTIE
ncbi:MAG: UvrD-helicase domain-containing protein [Planctomycetaceae bacterium]|nr:UvrD-helicase domain-containing protein [Planctomycetaceae bacterium]